MDSFLHLPPALFRKLFAGRSTLPLVSVFKEDSSDEAELMWAVEDETAPLNPKCIIQPFNATHNIPFLRRVLVGVEEESVDWKLIHEHWSTLEESILDQIRLLKKGSTVSLLTPWKRIQLFIEDFDAKSQYGVLDSDTELIIVPKVIQATPFEKQLQILPGSGDVFACAHFSDGVIRVGDFNVHVKRDESIPGEFIQIPYYLIDSFSKAKAKQLITCSITVQKQSSKHQFSFKVIPEGAQDTSITINDPLTTLTCSSGCALIKTDEERQTIYYRPLQEAPVPSSLSTFLMNPHSTVLVEGKIGTGKSVAMKEAIEQLNWSSAFTLPIEYLDLMDKKQLDLPLTSSSALMILDHFDEFVIGDESVAAFDEEAAIARYKASVKKISAAVQKYNHRFVLVVRTSRSLQKYWRFCALPIDSVFKFEPRPSPSLSANKIILNPKFEGVFGAEDVLKALQKHILNPIKYSSLFTANGLSLQTGVLLSGPSGSGKSFLAKSFLKAHGISFIACRGPELLDKYVGASEQAIRSLFDRARQQRPCVLFFDEFDSLVPQRGSNQSGVTDRIVNQFLTELDGTGDRSGVFLLACSSRKDLIDKAIMRPGRIDHCIELKLPTSEELIRETQKLPYLEHKELITGYLQRNPSISWADFRLFSACPTGEEVAKLFAKLEVSNAPKSSKPKGRKTQRLQLA